MEPKKPKFKIGDIVVIIMYGTVGTITKHHKLDQHYIYEVNHNDILYFESALDLYSDYEGKAFETELIEIEYQYYIGDLVQINGYGKDLFKIVGFRTEIWRYKEDGWEEMLYELVRVTDGEWLEAAEEELVMVLPYREAEKYLQQIQLLYYMANAGKNVQSYIEKAVPEIVKEASEERNTDIFIDEMLDIYNDYRILYNMFKDDHYKEMMDLVLQSIKRYASDLDE
ncbi:hypothetical protein GJU40_12140 [Bacillus lacus]|uniref:YodN n=1 Tax=Metabacillus lacus TaxID=1983721 RepID=A0A7X2LXT2_9BACI|nr:hypothetical protein [Metabacillus lacus]MRX72890.1 hypothetical protein [Metabacillus lacus]